MEFVQEETQSPFVEKLFEDGGGKYVFDNNFDAEEVGALLCARLEKNAKDLNLSESERARENELDREWQKNLLAWRKEYSGKIPQSWKNPSRMINDFMLAGSKNERLPDNLIKAGLKYPSYLVAEAVEKSQKLPNGLTDKLLHS